MLDGWSYLLAVYFFVVCPKERWARWHFCISAWIWTTQRTQMPTFCSVWQTIYFENSYNCNKWWIRQFRVHLTILIVKYFIPHEGPFFLSNSLSGWFPASFILKHFPLFIFLSSNHSFPPTHFLPNALRSKLPERGGKKKVQFRQKQ